MIERSNYFRFAAALSVFAALFFFTPAADPRIRFCGFHWITGKDCPFCGMTRAFFALAKGHWQEAIRFNVLSPLGFAMLFAAILDAPCLTRLWTFTLAAFGAYGLWRAIFL